MKASTTRRAQQGRLSLGWLLALGLVIMALAAGSFVLLQERKVQSQQRAAAAAARQLGLAELAESDVVRARVMELSQGLAISGTLKAVNSAVLKARVSGELQGLTVREGDFVTAGQVLARIDATEYRLRLAQVKSQADSARAQVEIAQRQYDNNKALVDQGFISRTSLDTSLANLNAAQATYRAALSGADVSARSVGDTVLRAPIAGQVSQRLAQSGERVGIDSRIVEIVDLSRLELEAALGAAESVAVRLGQVAELSIEGSAQPVLGRVSRINPSAQAGSRSVLAYLSIDNPASSGQGPGAASGPALRQGMFAQGTLGTSRVSVLSVPLTSVRTDKPVPFIQLIESDRIVHRSVTPGPRGRARSNMPGRSAGSAVADGDTFVAVQGVESPVAEGALVLRGHIGLLREGTPVRFTALPGAAAAASTAGGAISPAQAPARPAP